jgi:undecaprenyl-diphosphatase
MNIWDAIILAIIEGITEFLPISSTGHLIIGSSMLGIASHPYTKVFTIAIQLGAILSVVVLYAKRFLQSLTFYVKLGVAFLPAGIAGLMLNDYIDAWLERVDVVGYMLLIGGIIFLGLDTLFRKNEDNPDGVVSLPGAFKIGIFQCLALVPGVSRSAATIIGGLAQGLNRRAAAEFSFFLAVPTMFAATAYKLFSYIKTGEQLTGEQVGILVLGNAVAFLVALLAIKSFIGFLTHHGFRIFGYYRIVAGLLLLLLYYLGVELRMV